VLPNAGDAGNGHPDKKRARDRLEMLDVRLSDDALSSWVEGS
jgi:hypothetical protein